MIQGRCQECGIRYIWKEQVSLKRLRETGKNIYCPVHKTPLEKTSYRTKDRIVQLDSPLIA